MTPPLTLLQCPHYRKFLSFLDPDIVTRDKKGANGLLDAKSIKLHPKAEAHALDAHTHCVCQEVHRLAERNRHVLCSVLLCVATHDHANELKQQVRDSARTCQRQSQQTVTMMMNARLLCWALTCPQPLTFACRCMHLSHDGVSRLVLKFQSCGPFLHWDGAFWRLSVGFPKRAAPIEPQSPQEAMAADIAVSFEAKSGLSFAQAVTGLTSDVAALATNLFFEELAHAEFYEAGGVVNVAFKQIIALRFANAQPSGIPLKDPDVREVDTGKEKLHSQVGGGAVNKSACLLIFF